MQKLTLGQTNRVFLNTGETVDSVLLSVVDPEGEYVLDGSSAALQDKTCVLDGGSGKYYFDVTFKSTVTPDDVYLYWVATNSSIAVDLEPEYDPEDAILVKKVDTDILLASPSFVMDNFLRGITETEIAATYQSDYRSTIRDQIRVATDELERDTLVYFTPQTVTGERHDYYMRQIYEKFWTQNLYEYPIISITRVRIMLKDQEVVDMPEAWIQIGDPLEGRVKIIPYAGGAAGLAFRMITRGSLGLALILGEGTYVPDFFEYDYVHGLQWSTLERKEKTDIKNAIGRRVALNMLPNLDTHRGISSESRSLDGGSTTRSYTSSATFGEHSAALLQYKKAESAWINSFKRKYLKRLQVEGW